jgi:hypothetical protein
MRDHLHRCNAMTQHNFLYVVFMTNRTVKETKFCANSQPHILRYLLKCSPLPEADLNLFCTDPTCEVGYLHDLDR